MENIRGLMGLSLFFNPTQLPNFELYILKLANDRKLIEAVIKPKTPRLKT